MATEADAVAYTREILRAAGGSLAMSDLFNLLFRDHPEVRPVIRRAKNTAKKFCERHQRDFSIRPGGDSGGSVTLVDRGGQRGGPPPATTGRNRPGGGAGGAGVNHSARRQIRAITTATAFCTFIYAQLERQVSDRLELQGVFDAWLASDDCPGDVIRNFNTVYRNLFLTGILHAVGPAVVYSPVPGLRTNLMLLDESNPVHQAIIELRRLARDAPPPVHTVEQATQRVDERRREHEADKGGITVGPLTLEPTQRPGSTQSAVVNVRNDSDETVHLLSVAPLRFQQDLRAAPTCPVSLPPHTAIELTVTCMPTMPQGVLRTVLVFDFGPEIQIGRYLEIVITDPADDALRAQTPFVRQRRRPCRELGEEMLEGDRPPGAQTEWTEPLDKYPIPEVIKNGDWKLKDARPTAEQLDQLQLTERLSPDNFAARFQQ